MLDIKVETFLTVCQEHNFTRAAEKLHITQPAVSMHIRNLEEYYGVPLFQFQGKRFALTSYGELVYESLHSLKNNDKYLKETLNAMKTHTKIINMGATITLAEFMITDSISQYIQNNENAEISVMMGNTQSLLSRLDKGELDFILLEGDFSKTDYSYQTLYNADFTAICAADYPIVSTVQQLKDLTNNRLIIRESGSGTRRILEQELGNEGLSVESFAHVTTIGSMNAIIDIIKNDCGITFLYKKAVQPLLDQHILKEIPLNNFPLCHEISAVWRKDTLQENNLKALISEIWK